MSYPMEWKGNADEETGTAIFMVEGIRYVFGLSHFADSLEIGKMLAVAFESGKECGVKNITSLVRAVIKEQV